MRIPTNESMVGGKRWRGYLWVALMGLLGLVVAGCDEETVDVQAPAIPNGVSTITGDGEIWVIWNANREYDLSGYRIYSTSQVDQNYQPINWQILLEIGTPFPDFSDVYYEPDGSGGRPYLVFIDRSVTNGLDYYYAISAFDEFGNESGFSTDLAVDTPRPEGSVTLVNASLNLAASGFDFSEKSIRSGGDPLADVIFDVVDGLPTLQAQTPWVRIQDYGSVDFDIASWAPEFGWSAIDMVEAIAGHSYFLEIVDGDELNYAKVSVLAIDSSQISLKWGYQPVVGLPELKQPLKDLPPRIARKEG